MVAHPKNRASPCAAINCKKQPCTTIELAISFIRCSLWNQIHVLSLRQIEEMEVTAKNTWQYLHHLYIYTCQSLRRISPIILTDFVCLPVLQHTPIWMTVFLGVSSLLQTANPQSPMLVFSTQGNDLIRVSLCTSWKTGQDSRLHCRCPPMKVNFIGNAEPKRCVKSTSLCAFPRTTMGGVGPTATSLGPQLRCPARLFSVCRPVCWL